MIVYLTIGNSDDKLTQLEWAKFITRVRADVLRHARVTHGEWFSHPAATWQNACWCLEFADMAALELARQAAIEIRDIYNQDAVAWARAEVEFI